MPITVPPVSYSCNHVNICFLQGHCTAAHWQLFEVHMVSKPSVFRFCSPSEVDYFNWTKRNVPFPLASHWAVFSTYEGIVWKGNACFKASRFDWKGVPIDNKVTNKWWVFSFGIASVATVWQLSAEAQPSVDTTLGVMDCSDLTPCSKFKQSQVRPSWRWPLEGHPIRLQLCLPF